MPKFTKLEDKKRWRQNLSRSLKQRFTDPEYKRRRLEILHKPLREKRKDPDFVRNLYLKASETKRRLYANNPHMRERNREVMKKLWADPEYRKRQSALSRLRWQDPKYREHMRKMISMSAKKRWADLEFRRKVKPWNKGLTKRVIKNCANCDKPVSVKASQLKHHKTANWFCSPPCRYSYFIGSRHPSFGRPRPDAKIRNSHPRPEFRGQNNPMFNKTRRFMYSSIGFRSDLGHICRSTWEANYCRILKFLGIIYEYEPESLVFENNRTYTPDIRIGSLYIEIKGYLNQEAQEKLTAVKTLYPKLRFILIDEKPYRALQRQYSCKIPEWEFVKGTFEKTDRLAKQRAYNLAHKEERRQYCMRYYRKNKEKIKEKGKAYREENKQKVKERKLRYYKENHEKIAAHGKVYREQNREKIHERKRLYAINNREKIREHSRRYRQLNHGKVRAYERQYYLKRVHRQKLLH